MNDGERIDEQAAWAAVTARDKSADGRFVTGVLTTGIYCRPSCAARHPKRENVRFFATGGEARAAGLRPCLRCRPDEISREVEALDKALRMLASAEEAPSLDEIAAAAGYSPHHFHRLFKRATGVTPSAYYRSLRARRATEALAQNGRITDAIYDAGYSGPARFYADARGRLGMTPTTWRAGRWRRSKSRRGRTICRSTCAAPLSRRRCGAS